MEGKKKLNDLLSKFSFIGCNPTRYFERKYLFFYSLCGQLLLLALVTVYVREKNNFSLEDLAYTIVSYTIIAQLIVKLLSLFLQKKKIISILKQVDFFWDEGTFPENKNEYLLQLNHAHRNILFFNYVVFVTMFLYILSAIYQKDQIIRTWLPFDRKHLENNSIVLIATILFEVFTLFYTVWFCLVPFDCLFYFFIVSAILQLRLLGKAFEKVRPINLESEILPFRNLVIHHIRIYKFIEDINDYFLLNILFQIGFVLFAICMTIYLISANGSLLTNNIAYFGYITCNVFELYMYCQVSEDLKEECGQIAESLYSSRWYDYYDHGTRNGVIMVLQRSQKCCNISAGFFNLSLDFFVKVLKLSFSFYTFLKKTKF